VQVLTIAMSDRCEAFELDGDGTWTRRTPESPVDLQAALLERAIGQAG